MPELRTVYFASNDKWFDTYEECIQYEEILELEQFLRGMECFVDDASYLKLAATLVKYFNITKRLDYIPLESTEETQDLNCREGEEIAPYSGDGTEDSPNGTL